MNAQVEPSEITDIEPSDKPSGPAAAAFVAAGVGSLVMGLMVNVNEYSAQIKSMIGFDASAFLAFDKNYGLGSGVGALSGKVIITLLAYVISWAVFFLLWRRREINIRKAFIWTVALVAIGFLLTFPPVFTLFA